MIGDNHKLIQMLLIPIFIILFVVDLASFPISYQWILTLLIFVD